MVRPTDRPVIKPWRDRNTVVITIFLFEFFFFFNNNSINNYDDIHTDSEDKYFHQ